MDFVFSNPNPIRQFYVEIQSETITVSKSKYCLNPKYYHCWPIRLYVMQIKIQKHKISLETNSS